MSYFGSLVPATLLIITVMALASCSATSPPAQPSMAPDNRAADESAIRNLDAEWVKAFAAKDAHQAASFYADGASLLLPASPVAMGKDTIEKTFSATLSAPGFALTFAPTKIEVSRAGDLAYELGDYHFTMPDKQGKPQTAKAHYVVVWAKQPDGGWKALVDAPTTTQ